MVTMKTPAATMAELTGTPTVKSWLLGATGCQTTAVGRMDALTTALLIVNARGCPARPCRGPGRAVRVRRGPRAAR